MGGGKFTAVLGEKLLGLSPGVGGEDIASAFPSPFRGGEGKKVGNSFKAPLKFGFLLG
jgi:hypothetical protein